MQFPVDKLSILTSEERKIVVYYFGIGKQKLTLAQIAELLRKPGVNTNYVRNQVYSALCKIGDAKQPR